jgi:uncharacterized protein (DUF433 family)
MLSACETTGQLRTLLADLDQLEAEQIKQALASSEEANADPAVAVR